MQQLDDQALLRRYANEGSDEAFAALVQRHINLVYSVALRQVCNPQNAEEVTQAVFIVLSKKAQSLRNGDALSSWLFQTTRLTARNFIRSEVRRRNREQEAYMQSVIDDSGAETWTQIAPFLNSALAALKEKERDAILLRYFEGRSLREVGAAMGISEVAAQKRLARGLEKLRGVFAKRGVAVTAATLVTAMGVQSSQAAPVGLALAVTTAAKGSAGAAATGGLVHATMKTLAWAKAKTVAAYGAAVVLAGTAIVALYPKHAEPAPRAVSRAMPVREPLTDSTKMSFDAPPGSLALQKDGKIVVGSTLFGFFLDDHSGMLGQYTRGAFRLNADGSLDRTFLCDVGRNDSASQYAKVDVGADGRILLSGVFKGVNGTPRNGYALLQADGSLDKSFEPWRGTTNGGMRAFQATWLSNGNVAILATSVEGYRGTYPKTSYQLDAAGKWIQPEGNQLSGGLLRPSGLVMTLGPLGFWARKAVDWHSTKPAARQVFRFQEPRPVTDLVFEGFTEPPSSTDAAVALRALFEEVPMDLCKYAVRLPDGGAILAVRDRVIDGSLTGPGRFMRFDKDWKPDFTFSNSFEGSLSSDLRIRRQADGKFLVSGLVGTMNGAPFPGLVRLTENGQIDPTFHCTTTNGLNGRVMDVANQPDGRIVICGFFNVVNGVEMAHIARLNPDGSIDPTFHLPFMTLEQFSRERFKKKLRVPVARIAKDSKQTATTAVPVASTVTAEPTVVITTMQSIEGTMTIGFVGAPRREYVLQAKDVFDAALWTNIATNRTSGGGVGSFTDATANEHPTRFYRLAVP